MNDDCFGSDLISYKFIDVKNGSMNVLMQKIDAYCEILDIHFRQAYSSSEHRETRLSALNKTIDYLNSLKTQVKSTETQDLIDSKIAALNYCVERDVTLDPRRLDDMDRIIRKARTER